MKHSIFCILNINLIYVRNVLLLFASLGAERTCLLHAPLFMFYMSKDVSTYKCGECVKELRTVRNEDTPIRTLRSTSTSELEKKVVSPGRDLILPEITNVESVCVS
jgi:hypothetical protein